MLSKKMLNYIQFMVGGLGFEDNTFRYSLPIYEMNENIPDVLEELFIELGITEYPFVEEE